MVFSQNEVEEAAIQVLSRASRPNLDRMTSNKILP
jgi:hypothetical protein